MPGEKSGQVGLMPGVAQYVLANSHIPVLLLRDPREAAHPDFTENGAA